MGGKLNPRYALRLIEAEEISVSASLALISYATGLCRQVDPCSVFVNEANYHRWPIHYKRWSERTTLYCWNANHRIEGVPREIIRRNWCDSCGAPLHELPDQLLHRIGYGIYRRLCTELTDLAVKHYRHLILGGMSNILKSGKMKNGLSKDHAYSVGAGFENDIPEWKIAAPSNLELIPLRQNIVKGRKCSIDADALNMRFEALVAEHPEWMTHAQTWIAQSMEGADPFGLRYK